MKLTAEHTEILKKNGYTEKDMKQIQEVLKTIKIELEDTETGEIRRIKPDEAEKILGRKTFLSGLGRASFHYTSLRKTEDNSKEVSFDAYRYFR